ncbi:MAG TPA: ABC transporter permease [Flavisolibacter sp.]|jgi:putative ABC transport system permease protein|nr:ABC transporter permease [Flavisolibacter sp.]
MFRSYLKVAIRNLWKNKIFSFINIAGLATGLGCFLLISLYVLDELSYDRYNKNAERIYRINADIRFGGSDLVLPVTSDMMGATLKKDYPQVEEFTRIYTSNGNKLIRKGNEFINEYNVAHVDSTFFDIFTVTQLYGNLHTALNEPNTVVLTASAAKKYFGTIDVLGKSIETNDDKHPVYKITGVIRDIPHNSHFNLDFFFSMKNVDYDWGKFLSHNFHTYLLLKKGTDYKAFEKKFDQYIDKYVLPQAKQYMNINSMEEFKKAGNRLEYSLIPLAKIHLYSDRQFELSPHGNIQYVYIFSAVALFILLIACVNFMNLTTARSSGRAKEVGIRKVLGTERKNLISQFLTESILMAVFSLFLALGITFLVLPVFNEIAAKSMHIGSLFSSLILPLIIVLPFIVGVLAGSYPAFFLSSFRPIEVLKGKFKIGVKSGGLRNTLVVFQFFTSIFLIISTIVIYKQLHYIQTTSLGYNKDQILVVDNVYALKNNSKAFKNEVLKLPGVQNGTLSSFLPVSNSSRNDNTFSKDAVIDVKNGFDMQNWTIDQDYLNTMGIRLIKGRNFSKDFGNDTNAIIINETAARILGYDDPVGKQAYCMVKGPGQIQPFTIIGVVKNFNFESLRQSAGPLAFFLGNSTGSASFKITTKNIPALIKNIEGKWKDMASGMPFSYRFLDDSFNEMYRDEMRVGKIALIFSILAILIACLGLFGLATFVAELRTKEIGIRKVLGASVQTIVTLLSKDFLRLVCISFLLAAPFGWYLMNKWLQDFVYRINISWWIIPSAGIAALIIALVTVSFQAIRAAFTNPVKNLRAE